MKFICIAAMALACIACNRKTLTAGTAENSGFYMDTKGNKVLLGIHPQEALQTAPFADWFNTNFSGYTIDSNTVALLKPLAAGKHVDIFMGTWCGDSKREVPRMCKVLAAAGVHRAHIRLIMVDNRDSSYKQSPGHKEKGKFIHHVPTLFVYKGAGEMNRIVESPVTSIEKDLLSILSGKTYQPNYAGTALLQQQLNQKDAATLLAEEQQLLPLLQPQLRNAAELNTVGYVWMASGKWQQAQLAFELNALLFPDNVNVYDSLGELFIKLNDKPTARIYYNKVLALQPSNANAQKMILQLQ
ncbi:MAG TPA: hypothetical protein VL307_21115 [Chitinophagaceae bacterium]|nr:hypothetical protein [Chitinophagaceae bacterium]